VLKLRVAPTDRARKLELVQKYQELKKAPRTQQIDTWIEAWERTYTQMKEADLPDVQDDRALFDFILAIKSLDSTYASTHEVLLNEKIRKKEEIPTLYEAVADFRNHLRLNRVTTKAASHTAFATLNGEPQEKPLKPQNSSKT
jgi:hypothetical protein